MSPFLLTSSFLIFTVDLKNIPPSPPHKTTTKKTTTKKQCFCAFITLPTKQQPEKQQQCFSALLHLTRPILKSTVTNIFFWVILVSNSHLSGVHVQERTEQRTKIGSTGHSKIGSTGHSKTGSTGHSKTGCTGHSKIGSTGQRLVLLATQSISFSTTPFSLPRYKPSMAKYSHCLRTQSVIRWNSSEGW